MIQNEKKPKVSVCVITYNHEKYIRQCLQSIVDQETDFDFEVIVGEDCSTDGTRSIVQEFAERYPAIVKPLYQEKNTGGSKNFLDVHAVAKGEYVAHIDGDDYALPGKLQIQADFLDKHQECNIVWHRMYVLNDKTGDIAEDLIDIAKLPKGGFRRGDIMRFITIGMHSAKMYRAKAGRFNAPEFPILDYFANVEQIGSGAAYVICGKPLGVYRAGIGLASAGNTSKVLLRASFLYFSKKYPAHKKDICAAALLLFISALKNRKWASCKLFLEVIAKTFRFGALLDIWRNRDAYSMFRLPTLIRNGGR